MYGLHEVQARVDVYGLHEVQAYVHMKSSSRMRSLYWYIKGIVQIKIRYSAIKWHLIHKYDYRVGRF
jgi:hypothetical protein